MIKSPSFLPDSTNSLFKKMLLVVEVIARDETLPEECGQNKWGYGELHPPHCSVFLSICGISFALYFLNKSSWNKETPK